MREGRDGKVTYHAANCNEPYDHIHDLAQLLSILPDDAVDCEFAEELQTDVEIEDSADANGSKEADEKRLAKLLDLMDFLVHCEHYRQAAKQEHKNAEGDQTVDGHHAVVSELIPRADGSEPHEDGDVEKHIDGRLKGVI